MSVFRVKMNNGVHGNLDIDPTTGVPFTDSVQRQMFVAGPRRITRKLSDSETFTDSNYWKRFAFPQMSLDQAFIEVLTDDGSTYSDVPSENTFSVISLTTTDPETIDYLTTYGGVATYVNIMNLSASPITVDINGTGSTFTLGAGDTIVFDNGDLAINKLIIAGDTGIQVIAGVRIVSAT